MRRFFVQKIYVRRKSRKRRKFKHFENENDDNIIIEKTNYLLNSLISYVQEISIKNKSFKQISNAIIIRLRDDKM